MKKSKRLNVYSVRGESYSLAERIYVPRQKHGRTKKQHYLSKQARRSVEKGRVDGVDLRKLSIDDLNLFF